MVNNIRAERLRWPGDDGYDRMGFAQNAGWTPIAAWGRDGWDLGSWPLVCVYFRTRAAAPCAAHAPDTAGGCTICIQPVFERAVDVEGDVTVEQYETRDERDQATDETALFYWLADGAEWLEGAATLEQMPAHLRGPFSWDRAKVRA